MVQFILGVIVTITIITAIWAVMELLKGKKNTTKEAVASPVKTVIHRKPRPKFSISRISMSSSWRPARRSGAISRATRGTIGSIPMESSKAAAMVA